ncbi:MAG: LysR family transcriptional regulator [Casimicrobiaceae bacterium]|nr:LysR family transcriptional regulator [Casimicrobiaceae bacterium]MCX8097952.1 LysR family transcriptional regulator [Casimicrobiaceae bacterium]MDW8313055.1 LysR family transcriptional regulator [Burkholderiales bacterium]
MHLTLRQLRIFDRVAHFRSISRAAEALHLTQPAVSMQIKQLESQVGLVLIEQVGKRMELTEAGEELWAHARRVAAEVDELIAAMRARRGMQRGRVRLAVVATANYFVPRAIAAFRRRYPHLAVELTVGNRQAVFDRLSDHATDLVIAGQPPEGFSCVAEPFLDNPLVVIGAPEHPLAGRKRVGLAELAREPFVLREPGSGTRAALLRHLAEHQLEPRIAAELPTVEAVKQAVQAGLGLGVVSAQSVELEISAKRLVVIPVVGFPLVRQWYVIHDPARSLSPAAQAFRELLMAQYRPRGSTARSSPRG